MYSTSTYRIKKGDFFCQIGLIFLVLVNLKRGSPSHVLASVVAPF